LKFLKSFTWFIVFVMFLSLTTPLSAVEAADTISVKLSNYIGNKTSIPVSVKAGTYRVKGANNRLAGADRFEVAVNVSKEGWTTSKTVFLSNYMAFADALSATPLAKEKNAPILLTHKDNLTTASYNEIRRLKATEVYIIGGTGSISGKVESQIKGMGISVVRIGGADRFEVAQKIAQKMGPKGSAIVANGLKFPDALAIAPYAASKGYPILLTKDTSLPTATKNALGANNTTNTIVVGGTGSVSASVYNSLSGTKMRIGGADRYEVSTNVIKQLNLPTDSAFVATGLTFADALTGSVLAANNNAPLLLTRPTNLPDTVQNLISTRYIPKFTVLGGTGSVAQNVMDQLPNNLKLNSGSVYYVKKSGGNLYLYEGSKLVVSFGTREFSLYPASYGSSNIITVNSTRDYLGEILFTHEGNYIRPVNVNIPFEDYLKGVVPREMPASWHPEALKAQAIAARTYADSYKDIALIDDTIKYQVYGGYDWDDRSTLAVNQTVGKKMYYGSTSLGVNAVYTSANGGVTVDDGDEWSPGKPGAPYLYTKADTLDTYKWTLGWYKTQIDLAGKALDRPQDWWTSVSEKGGPNYYNDETSYPRYNAISIGALKNWIKTQGYQNTDIKITRILEFTPSAVKDGSQRSRTAKISIEFLAKNLDGTYVMQFNPVTNKNEIKRNVLTKDLSIHQFKTIFGYTYFRSYFFDAPVNTSDVYVIKGKGFGHGVGMSQHGAQARAAAGQTYDQILKFYYSNNGYNFSIK
jgi:SpoIID/LytB domain protein